MLDIKKLLATIAQQTPQVVSPGDRAMGNAVNRAIAPMGQPESVNDQLVNPGFATQAPPPMQAAPSATMPSVPALQPVATSPVPGPAPVTPPAMTPIAQARADYETALTAPAEKQNPWLQGLSLALQGIDKFASGMAGRPNNAPIEMLGNRKKAYKVGQAAATLAPLQELEKYDQQSALNQARIDNEMAKPADRDADRQAKINASAAVTDRLNRNLDFRKGVAKPFVDAQGKVWMQYLNNPDGEMKPLMNPGTNIQESVPGEQGIQWLNPRTKQMETIKARQGAAADATIAAGDAGRQQSADQFNAGKEFEAVKENVRNQLDYSKAVFDRLAEIAKTNAEVQGAGQATQSLYQQMEQANAELGAIDPITNEKGYETAHKRFNELQDKFYQAANKTQAGAELIKSLESQGITRPPKVDYKPIKAVKIGGGTPVPKSKDPLGLFQ